MRQILRTLRSPQGLALGMATALLGFRYVHEIVKLGLRGQSIDFAAYYLYTRGLWHGLDPFAAGALTPMAESLGSAYTLSPPTFAPGGYALLAPFALLPYPLARLAWLVLGQGCVLLGFERWRAAVGLRGAQVVAGVILTLAFQPIFENVATGQLSLLILALLALGIRAQLAGFRLAAAVPLSLAFQLKPHYMLLVVIVAWIGAPLTAGLILLLLGLWAALAALLLGVHWVPGWIAAYRALGHAAWLHGWLRNLSPHALLHRLAGDDGRIPVDAVAIALALATGVAVLWATRPSGLPTRDTQLASWALAIAALPLASPLTEEHHLAILLLPLLFLVARAESLSPLGLQALLASAILLAGRYSPEAFPALRSGIGSLAYAGKALGAALLFGVAWQSLRQARAAAVSQSCTRPAEATACAS